MSFSYKCLYCERTFASPYGLKRHISEKHQYNKYNNNEIEDEGAPFQTKVVEEPGLWDDEGTPFQMNIDDLWDNPGTPTQEEPGLWDEDFMTNYTAENEKTESVNLEQTDSKETDEKNGRSDADNEDAQETDDESERSNVDSETDEETDVNK